MINCAFSIIRAAAMGGLVVYGSLAAVACGSVAEEEGCGECIQAVQCVDTCGGEVVQEGCCACPLGSVDSATCGANGGAGGEGGSGGTGGEDCGECLRAIDCVEECGGEVLQSGCCACDEGTFDNITCEDTGGAGGGGAGS